MTRPTPWALSAAGIVALLIAGCAGDTESTGPENHRPSLTLTGGCSPTLPDPAPAEGEIFGNVYVDGDRGCGTFSVELHPESSSFLYNFNPALNATSAYSRMFEYWDPASGEQPCQPVGSLSSFHTSGPAYGEVSHAGTASAERHCVRPGRYSFSIVAGVEERTYPVDYVQPSGSLIHHPGMQPAIAEATSYSASNPYYSDLIIHTDFTSTSYSDTPVLHIDNAASDPADTDFSNATNPSGTAADWMRFSALASTSTWISSDATESSVLARLYFNGPGLSESTGYWDFASEGTDVIRVFRFPNPGDSSATYTVGLEILRPDEEPNSADTVARSIVINRIMPDLAPGTINGPSTMSIGGTHQVQVQHKNLVGGTVAPVEAGWIGKIYLSTDANLDAGDTEIGSYTEMAEIVSSSPLTRSYNVSIPTSQTAGTYYLLVKLDVGGVILEASESNNIKNPAPTVSVSSLRIDTFRTTACSQTTSGGVTYNRWTQSWTGITSGLTFYSILETTTADTTSGSVVKSGKVSAGGSGAAILSYQYTGGTTNRYFWLKFSNAGAATAWFSVLENPLNVSGACAV